MNGMEMFAKLDKEDQERVLRLMRAFASKDEARASWAWLVCRISVDATGNARTVALLRVEDGLKWREIAERTHFTERNCFKLYKKAMQAVEASKGETGQA